MILEKVYDELIAMIEDLKKKVDGISGGSTVTITPALDSGTKVADFEIDGTEGSIYAPTPIPFSYDFSTTEQEVGTWIDGRPLYRKTYNVGAMPNNAAKEVTTLTVEEVRQFFGSCNSRTEGSIDARPLPMTDTTLANNIRVDVTSSVLNVRTGADWSSYDGIITILYTKTTDTPPTRTKKKK